jgi:hypothetical protein
MKKILFTTAMFVFAFQTIAYCQTGNDALSNAVSRLKTQLTGHEVEKAYLQFDRPYACYAAGEIVYFKAYVTMGERHEPSTISSILHVDLINKNDVPVQSISLALTNGTGWGDFTLPDSLQKGSYRIRAWTNWMRNDKHPRYFDQNISVSSVNGVDRVAEAAKQGTPPSLQLFPEGGNLVAGVHSKVAFKAVGADGLGVNVKGAVIDDENNEVAEIASTHLGMGVFDFVPEPGRAYQAKVTFADGTQSSFDLPAAETKGVTLAVNAVNSGKLYIEIKANNAYFKENQGKDLNVLVYSGGTVKKVTTKLDYEVTNVDLPANDLRTGVLQVTLLSATGEPLCERLAFIQNPDLLSLAVTANKTTFAKRENVALSLNVKSKEGNVANGSFSVSVVDESKILIDESTGNSILSYLLLSSDLKGYVEKPNYYFANMSTQTRADLDVLMLTQGYRRFVWKELLTENAAANANSYNPEKNIYISGILKTKAGEPIASCNITLLSSTGGDVLNQTTDAAGKFRFDNVLFETGTKFILKAQGPLAKKALLTIDKQDIGPEITAQNAAETRYNSNADILAALQNSQVPVYAMAGKEPALEALASDKVTSIKRNDNYRSSNIGGPGHADQVIMGDDIINYPSLSLVLRSLGRGVLVDGGIASLESSLTISGKKQQYAPMLVIVDGTNMGQGYPIENYLPVSIETIEILQLPNASIYGGQGASGVLVLTTRKRLESNAVVSSEMSPGIFSIAPKGFYKAREFYAPRYDAAQPAGNGPDNRTTVFWKPDVTTDASGNASFNFFNADGTGTYRVEVEGIDSHGNLGRQVFRYKVE